MLRHCIIIVSQVVKGKETGQEEVKKQTVSLLFAVDMAIKMVSVNGISKKSLMKKYFCSFISDQQLLRYVGVVPLHHFHSSQASALSSSGSEQAINVGLKA